VEKTSGASWRFAIVCALTLVVAALSLPDLVLPWHPFASFGFDVNAVGRVLDVAPGSAAADAGLRPGDTAAVTATDFTSRRYLFTPYASAPLGERATFRIADVGGARRSLTLVARTRYRSTADNLADIAQGLSYVVFLVIAAGLVLLRPSGLTWAFFAYALCAAGISVTAVANLPTYASIAAVCWEAVQSLAWLPFAIFALRFPADAVAGWRRTVQRLLVASSFALVPLAIYTVLGAFFGGPLVTAAFAIVWWILPVCGFAVGAMIFVGTYLHAPPAERVRLRWVILGFFAGYGGSLVANLIVVAGIGTLPIWFNDLVQTLNVAVPATVAYAIFKHRLIDIRFYLNRALVYGLLTTIAVGIMTLLHWLVSKQLEGYQLGFLPEIVGALVIGASILRLHKWLESLVDRFVFRSVHDAEQHLARVGDSMMYAQSVAGIDRLICGEPRRAFDLAWSAVFHAVESGDYLRTEHAGGDQAPSTEFGPDDAIVLEMCSSRRPVATRDAIAYPFVVRDEILGFALMGVHANGSAIDPNEREILDAFIRRASIGYDHLISKTRGAENARLKVENETLRSLIASR